MPQRQLLVATRNPGKMREYRELLSGAPYRLVSLDDAGVCGEVDETGTTFRENASLKATLYAAASGLWALADDSGLEVDALGGEPGVRSARYGEPPPADGAFTGGSRNDAPPAAGPPPAPARMSDQDRVDLVLRNMAGIPWARRTARFRCVICIAGPPAAAGLGRQGGEPFRASKGSVPSRIGSAETVPGAGASRGGQPAQSPSADPRLVFLEGGVAGMIQYEPQGEDGFGYDPVFFLPSYGRTMAQLPLAEKNRISHRADAARKAVSALANLRTGC